MSTAGRSESSIPASKSTSWADDESDNSEDEREFRAKMTTPIRPSTSNVKNAAPESPSSSPTNNTSQPPKDDAPVASLASRISGLSTSNTPSTQPTSSAPSAPSVPSSAPPTGPAQRPRPQANNNLFGKALAGVKSDRGPASSPAPPQQQQHPTPSGSSSVASSGAAPASGSGEKESSSSRGKELFPESARDTGKGKMTDIMDAPAVWGPNGNKDSGWGAAPSTNGDRPDDGKAIVDGFLDGKMTSDAGKSDIISNDFQVEADPNSPLYSVKDFAQLNVHPDLLKGIYGVGFKKPSKIQERALPLLLANPPKNLIGQSQSGTGKTAAFTLNLLARVSPAIMAPQAIVLAPSRELARQIQKVIDDIGQFTSVKTFLAVPGGWTRNVKIDKQILIGTPGTLVDMLSRGKSIFDSSLIRVLVLDEADEMVNAQGLGDQSRRVRRSLPPGVQRVLFSATFSDEVQEFAKEFAPEANQIFLKKEEVTVDAIKQLYLDCGSEDQKYEALSNLYDVMTIGQSIVFCRKRDTADRIAKRLTDEGHSVASLHGDKEHRDRDDILDTFREGKTKVLITTNVVARGIDIQQVNMVVNYDVPDSGRDEGYKADVETYIHRIAHPSADIAGRTGRFGRKGCSVTFVHDARSREDVEYIMRATGRSMKRIDASNKTDLEQLEKALKSAMKGPA